VLESDTDDPKPEFSLFGWNELPDKSHPLTGAGTFADEGASVVGNVVACPTGDSVVGAAGGGAVEASTG
jgi:hypothetical protein